MAVKVRLSRFGKKDKPTYRVIVTDSRNKRDGKFIDSIGFYNPIKEPLEFRIDKEKYKYWLSVGAQPSNTVKNLTKKVL